MANATGGEDYDFKRLGMNERDKSKSTEAQYMSRGGKDKNGEWASARDYGNFAAGMVASRKGLSWKQPRFGFDLLQGVQEKGWRHFVGPLWKSYNKYINRGKCNSRSTMERL